MTQDKLIAIIAQILELPPEQVHETSGVNETENWDSLKNMMIMMEIENRYGLRFDFDAPGSTHGFRTAGLNRILLRHTDEVHTETSRGALEIQPGCRPWKVPTIAAALPALQSVSQPAIVAISAVRGKSPAP